MTKRWWQWGNDINSYLQNENSAEVLIIGIKQRFDRKIIDSWWSFMESSLLALDNRFSWERVLYVMCMFSSACGPQSALCVEQEFSPQDPLSWPMYNSLIVIKKTRQIDHKRHDIHSKSQFFPNKWSRDIPKNPSRKDKPKTTLALLCKKGQKRTQKHSVRLLSGSYKIPAYMAKVDQKSNFEKI